MNTRITQDSFYFKPFNGDKSEWQAFEAICLSTAVNNELRHKGLLCLAVMTMANRIRKIAANPTIPHHEDTKLFKLADATTDPELHEQQLVLESFFRTGLEKALGNSVWLYLRKKHPVLTKDEVSTAQLMETLRNKYGKVTDAQVDIITGPLDKPFEPASGMKVSDYIDEHTRIHLTLAGINGGANCVPDSKKISNLRKGLQRHYATEIMLANSQLAASGDAVTYDAWVDTFMDVAEQMEATRTSQDAGYAGSVRAGACYTEAEMQARVAAARAEERQLAAAATNPTATGSDSPITMPSGATHYCWSHGPNKTHHGHQCEKPLAGHRPNATAAHPLGGRRERPRSYFKSGKQYNKKD
jgi:hypothetical protein